MRTLWSEPVHRERLPNGLTLLVQRDATIPTVAVVTHVRAGYFDEPDEWVGIAHVLEHMFFKGTATRGPGALARETQVLGGYLNAGTIYDKTVYYAVVPAVGDGLDRALALQADALMHAAIDGEELRRELEVIIQEANRKRDTPAAVLVESLYAALFTRHRMRRWRIGSEEGLRRLTAADVRRYYETRYTPERTVVALTGNLDPAAAVAAARAVYGGWQRPPAVVEGSPAEPATVTSRLTVLRGEVERPLAAIGWKTVGPLHPDTPALDVAAAVLGDGRASWLYRHVRLPGLAGVVGSSHYTPGDAGVFDVTLTADAATVDAAVTGVAAQVRRLATEGPAPDDLARVRALTETQWARRLESADGRATTLAEFEALGDVSLAWRYPELLQAVSAADVRRVAAAYLAPDRSAGVLYLSDGQPSALEGGAWPPA